MSPNESVECVKHLLAAERLFAASGDLASLAHLSVVVERMKSNHPSARSWADADEHHQALERADQQWAGLPG